MLALQSSLLTQLFAEQPREEREGIQDSGFGVWGGSMHGGMSNWVEEIMHGEGVTQGVLQARSGELLCVHRRSVCCLPARGGGAAVADVPRTLGWSRVLKG